MKPEPYVGMTTPWGVAQTVEQLAEGIFFVSTPSHGGAWVSQEWREFMPGVLKRPTNFYQGGPWFEEDCEILRVVVAFPRAFPQMERAKAIEMLSQIHPEMSEAIRLAVQARPWGGSP